MPEIREDDDDYMMEAAHRLAGILDRLTAKLLTENRLAPGSVATALLGAEIRTAEKALTPAQTVAWIRDVLDQIESSDDEAEPSDPARGCAGSA